MIYIKDGYFLSQDEKVLMIAGEVHYFRLPKSLWKTHLEGLIASGCNTVSTYVPWLIHEPVEDTYEFHGETLEQYDLISFLKLAQAYGLYIFLRPGPFVMAELYLEGAASYLKERQDVFPKTFGGMRVPNDQLDYLHPYFIERAKKYYDALFKEVKPFMQSEGGKIFGIQLDNEVGMLAWVSQSPALTEDVLNDLYKMIDFNTYTFHESHIFEGHQTLGHTLRRRYQTYVTILEDHLKSLVGNLFVPFINIHGTSGGRGLTFPIGYSQLIDTFPKRVIGTDVYFGDLTLKDFHDYYIIHTMLNALRDPNTPATTLEFNAGNSNFGDDLSGHDMPQSMDKKIRLHMVLGYQMINYYLLSAGMNPKTHPTYQTGNGRIALTGERHGFAAPVSMDGNTSKIYDVIRYCNHLWQHHHVHLKSALEVTSNITIGFQLDQFMTESMRHGTPIEPLKVDLTRHRTGVMWETFLKQALMLHVTFDAIHLEAQTHIDPKKHPVLVIATATYMSAHIQSLLILYHQHGGKLLMFGAMPTRDLYNQPDTQLIDYFHITPHNMIYDHESSQLSASYDETIEGYHEFRTSMLQPLKHDAQSLFYDLQGRKTSYVSHGVVWVTNNYPGHLKITKRILDQVGVKPIIDATHEGFVYIFKTKTDDGNYMHYFNMEPYEVVVSEKGYPDVYLKALDSVMCPRDLHVFDMVVRATCELTHGDDASLSFRTEGLPQTITIQTNHQLEDHDVCVKDKDTYTCMIPRHVSHTWTMKKA